MFKKYFKNKGFTLMVAVLVNAVLIVVGLGIYGIVFREFNLSIISRESQTSFYAADSLAECLIYWDRKQNAFEFPEAPTVGECYVENPANPTSNPDVVAFTYEGLTPQDDPTCDYPLQTI